MRLVQSVKCMFPCLVQTDKRFIVISFNPDITIRVHSNSFELVFGGGDNSLHLLSQGNMARMFINYHNETLKQVQMTKK